MNTIVKRDVYTEIENQLTQKNKVLIGVSGIKFSGKTTVANELTDYFSAKDISVKHITPPIKASILDLALKDKNPSKFFYENAIDFELLKTEIDHCEAQLVVVDSILLFKNTVTVPFDLKIWVDCTFTTSIARSSEAEKEITTDLYMWLMRQHFSIDTPKSKSDILIINDEKLKSKPEILVDSSNPNTLQKLNWLHEPDIWNIEDGKIKINTDAPTDFWQRTHYGFRNDNAHMMYVETEKDFVMTCHVKFNAEHQFDQCGLAIRTDEDNWLKTSIEYELGNPPKLGAVVTNLGYSDWSTEELGFNADEIEFRITREGYDYKIEYRFDKNWHQLRICHLHDKCKNVKCGVYCCSPIDSGYSVVFEQFSVVERFF